MKIVARFEVPYYQILNEQSQLIAELPKFAEDAQALLKLYREMVFTRVFDAKAIALQRTGKLGTYPSARGQEAVFVGVGNALKKTDIFVPYYRDAATLIQRGVKLSEIFLFWGGDERGNSFQQNSTDFPFCVPIATQTLHAAGVATAMKIRQQKNAVLTMCGEGGTSEGDFYEAMNIAGVWQLPLVFIVCNNQWAISVPLAKQTATQTIAQKAIAAGISGEQIDGNDVIAVRDRVSLALKKAREQHEPTLLEMITYRQGDHTTADDASRYEPKGNRESEWVKEPIVRLRRYLEQQNIWDEQQEQNLIIECTQKVELSVEEYLQTPSSSASTMFDYLYKTLPQAYQVQYEALKNLGKVHG